MLYSPLKIECALHFKT